MKKVLALVLCLILALAPCSFLFASAEEQSAGYTFDTETKTFTVFTAEGLNAVAALVNSPDENANLKTCNIILAADLDFTTIPGRNWIPIGFTSSDQKTYYPFSGTFDGAGHTIKGMITVSDTGSAKKLFQGLIGVGVECTIKNVTIKDSVIEGREYIGAILGVADGDATIRNCHVENCVINAPNSNSNNVGGICGRIRGGQANTGIAGYKCKNILFENCTVQANMSCFRNIGGICGGDQVAGSDEWTLTFRNCVTSGTYEYYHTDTHGCAGIFAYNSGNGDDTDTASMKINFENCVSVAKIVNKTDPGHKIYGSICWRLWDGAYTMKNCIGLGPFASTLDVKSVAHILDVDGCAIYDPQATATGGTASFWVDSEAITEPEVKTMTIDDVQVDFKTAVLPVVTTDELNARLDTIFEDEAFRARAKRIVAFATNHEHVFDQQETSEGFLKSRATCQAKAVYYYSCVCGLKGTETFEYGEIADHRFAEGWSMSETEHWHTCSDCHEEKTAIGEHTFGEWTVKREPTEKRDGERIRSCTVCGYEQSEKIPKVEKNTTPVEQNSGENVTTAEPAKKKGCGSTIAGGTLALFAVVSLGCAVTGKKKSER